MLGFLLFVGLLLVEIRICDAASESAASKVIGEAALLRAGGFVASVFLVMSMGLQDSVN